MARGKKAGIQPRKISVAAEIVAERRAKGEGWRTITIPKPPSVNAMYRNAGYGKDRKRHGRIKTAKAQAWAKTAGYIILAAGLGRNLGPYEIRLELGRRKGADLFNFEKGASDLLKTLGVIQDDSLCERGVVEWADDLASHDMRISIRPYVRTLAANERRKPKTPPELPPMAPVLDGTKFKKRTAPKLPRVKRAPDAPQQPNAAGLYVEKTEAGEQLTMIAPPSLAAAREDYIRLFEADVGAHPTAYKERVRANPRAHAMQVLRGLTVDEVRRMTRELAEEQREIERKTRPTPTRRVKAQRTSASKAVR